MRVTESPIGALLRAFDVLDAEAAIALFAPDGTVMTTFGEEATGIDGVRRVIEALFAELRATTHSVSAEWNPEPGVWIAELSATYDLTDYSRRGPYKRAIVLRADNGRIAELRMYGAHELRLSEGGRAYEDVRGPHGWLPTL